MNDITTKTTNRLPKWELGLFAPSVSQLTHPETISLLQKSGYKWVEWRVQTLQAIESSPWGKAFNTLTLDNLLEEAMQVAETLQGTDVRVSAMQLDAPEDFPGLAQTIREAADILNCNKVGISAPCFDPCEGFRSQKETFQKQIQKWIDTFGEHGVKVCLETHFGTITPSTALVMSVLERFSPEQVGVMWDPANMIYEGSELSSMALDLLGPYLVEVHLKNGAWTREADGKWNFTFCDLSEGMVSWPQILKMLADLPYRGPLIVEDYRWMDPEAKLANARREYENAVLAAEEND